MKQRGPKGPVTHEQAVRTERGEEHGQRDRGEEVSVTQKALHFMSGKEHSRGAVRKNWRK